MNLNPLIDHMILFNEFKKFGTIIFSNTMNDPETHKPSGKAKIIYSTQEEAVRA
jgi:RNA recognition motif-containing protein